RPQFLEGREFWILATAAAAHNVGPHGAIVRLDRRLGSIELLRLLAIAGRCAPSRRARTIERSRSARLQYGAYPCILGLPLMHLTAGWAAHRNRDARKAFEQNPLGSETR